MDFLERKINLKIRHFDVSDHPEVIEKIFEFYPNWECSVIKTELFKLCGASSEKQVLKIRNSQEMLVPISFLIENTESFYFVDVASISCFDKSKTTNNLLQDAYVDAVCNKVKSLEYRIAQAELLLPQLEWRRQAYMEDTVAGLLNKVQFLNRRFDELYPKYKADKMGSVSP